MAPLFQQTSRKPQIQISPTTPIFPQAIPVASNLMSAQQHVLNQLTLQPCWWPWRFIECTAESLCFPEPPWAAAVALVYI